ncbi:MAG TPA: hypothetical protein VED20_14115 [Streptosporangiaceae bacterium]|nr:hypothetical protein [Streptosporangiaceae bacterium]
MYDMYPWDGPARPAAPAGSTAARAGSTATNAAPATPATQAAEGARAVQVALDRRDNGGDAVGAAGEPTAGRTRQ